MMSVVSDSDLIKRLGLEGTRLLKRSRATRLWSSLGFVFAPLVLFAVLGLFHIPRAGLIVVAAIYVILGVPALIVLLVAASKDGSRAAQAAGTYLDTPRYTHQEAIPKILLRMPVEGLDSWMAVNHVPNPASPAAKPDGSPAAGAGGSVRGLTNGSGDPKVFKARWTGVITGGAIAMAGVASAVIFVALEIASLVSGQPAASSVILLILLCVCCFAVGLPVMYGSSRKIARDRAQWYQDRDGSNSVTGVG
jgi:hypothetical protein